MGVVPDLKVSFVDFGKVHLAGKRFLEGSGIGHPQQDVSLGYASQTLQDLFGAVDVFEDMQAKNHVKAFRRKGIRGDLRPDHLRGEPLFLREPDTLRIRVGSPHVPTVSGKDRQGFSPTATPVEQGAGRMGMAAKQFPGANLPVLLIEVMPVDLGINLVREMGNHKGYWAFR